MPLSPGHYHAHLGVCDSGRVFGLVLSSELFQIRDRFLQLRQLL
jgi:hypothetical protein